MSKAYETLEARIRKAGEKEDSFPVEKLEAAVYRAYTADKISSGEYNQLCCLIDCLSG